jgi:hypothetical protein
MNRFCSESELFVPPSEQSLQTALELFFELKFRFFQILGITLRLFVEAGTIPGHRVRGIANAKGGRTEFPCGPKTIALREQGKK